MNADEDQTVKEQRYRTAIEEACSDEKEVIHAKTFQRGYRTKAEPVLLACTDGQTYMVKGQQAGRQIVNDQIVARLGMILGAPVGKPQLIDIPRELIEIEPKLSHIPSGISHGSLFIPGCSDQFELIATSEQGNRGRLALLAVLFSWIVPNDWQFLFSNNPPRLIHSVDHGHFFPNGPNWDIDSLSNEQPPYLPSCFKNCRLTAEEIAEALDALKAITFEQLVKAVAMPPKEWGLTMDERIQLIHYLSNRQKQLTPSFVMQS